MSVLISEVADVMITAGMTLHEGQAEITKHMLEAALRKTGGNKSHAARLLHLHRNNLDRNLARHKINWREFRWPTTRSRRLALAAPAAG